MKKNKIVFFLPSFENGGAEETIISLANQFNINNQNLTFIVGNKNGANKNKIDENISLINLNKKRLLKCLGPLNRIIVKLNPKIIITTLTHSNLFFCFLKYFYKYNFRLIIRETNITPTKYFSFKEKFKFKFLNFLKKKLYNFADYVIAINSKSKKELIDLGIKKDKIKIFNNPSIKKNFHKKIKEKIDGSLTKKKYLLYVGRLVAHKNLDFLLEVFYEIQKKTNLNLILIGQGKEEERIKKKIKYLGIEKKVFFLGFKNNPLPYIKKASLFVSLSEYEGQPNSVIQSLACGTKTLIKNFPGLDSKIKNSKKMIIINKLIISKIGKQIIKETKYNKRKTFDNKIIQNFNEKKFMHQFKKLINV